MKPLLLSCVYLGLIFPNAVFAQTDTAPAADERSPYASPEPDHFPDLRFYLGEPNPAEAFYYGTGRLQLPSFRFDMGSNLSTAQLLQDAQALQLGFSQVFTGMTNNEPLAEGVAAGLETRLSSFLAQFQAGARLDYDLDYNLLGFGGMPLAEVQIMDRPLALGVHLGASGRGYLEARFSQDFSQSIVNLSAELPGLLDSGVAVSGLASNAGALIGQINQLNSDVEQLVQRANAFSSNPFTDTQRQVQEFNQLLGQVNGELNSLLPTARNLTGVVSNTTETSRSVLAAAQNISGGGLQLVSANDLHLTLGVSGAYPVFENEDIQVSVGTQLKLFMLPYQLPLQDLGIQSQAGLMGKLEVREISGLQDFSRLEATLSNLDGAARDVNLVVDNAERLSATVSQVETDLASNNFSNLVNNTGQALVRDANTFNRSINTARGTVQQASSQMGNLQQTMLSELQDVTVNGLLTTPSGAGFGLDLGVDALLYRHLRLGLSLQNPLVLWQGTERPFEARLNRSENGQMVLGPNLSVDDAGAQSVNYTATVPLSVLLSARYRFDDLLPDFQGLYAHSLLEVVANGRQPAWVLGAQKYFQDLFYVGIGGRLGGIGSLIYLEGGLNPQQGFGLDLQLGFSPAGSGLPLQGMSWLGLGRLGMSYRF